MPPHSSQPRRHLINGQSCPVRGPFILALRDARLPGRRAPHWADCASGSPSKLPWLLAHGRALDDSWTKSCFLRFHLQLRKTSLPSRALSQHRLIFLRPWSYPRFTGKPQTRPNKPGHRPRESPGSSSSHGQGGEGGRSPETHFLGDPRGGAVHSADGETGGWKRVPGCRPARFCPFSL